MTNDEPQDYRVAELLAQVLEREAFLMSPLPHLQDQREQKLERAKQYRLSRNPVTLSVASIDMSPDSLGGPQDRC